MAKLKKKIGSESSFSLGPMVVLTKKYSPANPGPINWKRKFTLKSARFHSFTKNSTLCALWTPRPVFFGLKYFNTLARDHFWTKKKFGSEKWWMWIRILRWPFTLKMTTASSYVIVTKKIIFNLQNMPLRPNKPKWSMRNHSHMRKRLWTSIELPSSQMPTKVSQRCLWTMHCQNNPKMRM